VIANLSQRLVVLFAFGVAPVGVLAPKGTVALLVITGLGGLVRWAADEYPRQPFLNAFLASLVALVLWAGASAAWAISPDTILGLVLRLTMLCVVGVGLLYSVAHLDSQYREKAGIALLSGLLAGLASMAVGYVYAKITGASLWSSYYSDPLTTLNNGAIAVSLLAWPAFAILRRRGQTIVFFVIGAAAYIGLLFLSSAAALLAPAVGFAGFAVVWLWRRPGALALGAIAAVLVLTAPQVVTLATTGIKASEAAPMLPGSARHRLNMWAFAVEKIEEKPLWGWGMDASRAIPQDDRRLAYNMEIMPLHPHNAFLQIRLELGIPGAIIAAALVYFFFSGIGAVEDRFAAAVMTGAGGAYLTVASVSYGIWQNWWLAFAWLLAALTVMALLPQASVERD
jgi:exopolysaccharide production protein ExoQ